MMMLKMIANHDMVVKKYLETSPGNARYTSPTIQNGNHSGMLRPGSSYTYVLRARAEVNGEN